MMNQAYNPVARRPTVPMQPTPLGELRVSLRALAHPVTLGAVALLVVNDHVLKRLAPSVLTGKLSDFAGLFFFPYLLIVFASLGRLAFSRFRSGVSPRTPRRISGVPSALIAFLVTAALFAVIKAIPTVSAAVSGLLTALFNLPIWITPDPTDLAALVALVPAYWLWQSLAADA